MYVDKFCINITSYGKNLSWTQSQISWHTLTWNELFFFKKKGFNHINWYDLISFFLWFCVCSNTFIWACAQTSIFLSHDTQLRLLFRYVILSTSDHIYAQQIPFKLANYFSWLDGLVSLNTKITKSDVNFL